MKYKFPKTVTIVSRTKRHVIQNDSVLFPRDPMKSLVNYPNKRIKKIRTSKKKLARGKLNS